MLKTMSVLLTEVRPQSPVYRRPYCPNMKARVSANPDGSPVGATNVNESSVTLVNLASKLAWVCSAWPFHQSWKKA
jgi:hypothetical protein